MPGAATAMDILSKIGAETATDKWWLHNYTPFYDGHFHDIRNGVTSLLELGIGGEENPGVGGHSLRMWKRYFPAATIVGLDIHDKSQHAEERIVTLKGSQSDPSFIADVVERYGPFDVVVDDGSHFSADVVASLELIWPAVRTGGFYVIEDVQYAFDPKFAKTGDIEAPELSINVIARLLRSINAEAFEGPVPGAVAASAEAPAAMHAYPNIVFLKKGPPTFRRAIQGGSAEALTASLAGIEGEIAELPDTAGLHYTRAVILNRLGNGSSADKAIATATKLAPNNAEYLHFYGNLKIQQRKFPAAIALQRRAIALSPGNPHFHERLSLALLKTKDYAAAAEEALRAITLFPENPTFHARYAEALTALGCLEEAQQAQAQASALAANS